MTRRRLRLVLAALAAMLAGAAQAQVKIDLYQRAPLADAATVGDAATVRKALAGGVSANQTDIDGTPAIILAAKGGYLEVVRLLVEAKARLDARDRLGNTALIWAAERATSTSPSCSSKPRRPSTPKTAAARRP